MKNVINKFLSVLKKIGDINLSIIIFILYVILFLPYKIFSKNKKYIGKWLIVEKFDIKNKYLPY